MTFKETCWAVIILTGFSFLAYRSIERRIWMDELRYEQGSERQALVLAHKIICG